MSAGDLTMVLEQSAAGIRLLNLFDSKNRQRLAALQPLPLFEITLRNAETGEELRIDADSDWAAAVIERAAPADAASAVELRWERPADKRLGELRVLRAPCRMLRLIPWHGNFPRRGRRRRGACGVSRFLKPPFRNWVPAVACCFRKDAVKCSVMSGAERFDSPAPTPAAGRRCNSWPPIVQMASPASTWPCMIRGAAPKICCASPGCPNARWSCGTITRFPIWGDREIAFS